MLKKEHVGKRVLIKNGWRSTVEECNVLELPSIEEYVKLETIREDKSRYIRWELIKDIMLLKVLGGKKPVKLRYEVERNDDCYDIVDNTCSNKCDNEVVTFWIRKEQDKTKAKAEAERLCK